MKNTSDDFSFPSPPIDLTSFGMKHACGDLHYQYGVLHYTSIKETCNFPQVLYFACKSYLQDRYNIVKIFAENKSQKIIKAIQV